MPQRSCARDPFSSLVVVLSKNNFVHIDVSAPHTDV